MLRIAALALLLTLTFPALAQKRAPHKPSAAEQAAAEQEQQDKQAIEDLHQHDMNARMSYNVDAIADLCDDEVVILPPEHPPIVGKAAYLAYLQQGAKGFENVDILGYNQQWQEVRQVGDYAYEWGSIQMRTRAANATAETQVEMNVVRVLKREPAGDWKIYRSIWNPSAPAQRLEPEKKLEEVPKKPQ